ncbi:transcriptional regulator family: Fungal Specific TF [Aspergillus niger]|nr:transcriptional regulator family: Fungal Specific TF [Aspergillus niger]KAI2839387.1 transcriptional regulator family: Fungal Specific TF [Aspergillus niger]KAI2880626.1 transcriptional regulator family: Fungal Specific TF [Aspergillus niger]
MRGCLTCRQRHLKCDKTGSSCLRCQRSGRQCIPAPTKTEEVTFRHGQNPSLRPKGPPRYGESDLAFPPDQIWVGMPAQVSFEDETDRTAADYHVLPVNPPSASRKDTFKRRSLASTAPSTSSHALQPVLSPSDSTPSKALPPQGLDPVNFPFAFDELRDRQKVASFNEAFLLRHFRKTLGPWLDVCDHERHFSLDVVERAPTNPLLLYACLAIAARHLSHTNHNIPPNTADGYHERCIGILLPVLENKEIEISIDILLASTVILRFFEQISSHSPSNDLQRHLLAGSVYISSQVECATSGGLAEASFWVFVMQDIQFALAYQKPLRLTLSPFGERLYLLWQHTSSQKDRDWTHKAIWLLAETINHCYGVNPSLEMEVSGSQSLHAIAVQHICMAKALILQQELRALYSTPSPQDIQMTEGNMTRSLSILFGIALSVDDEISLRVMACHALCACGSWIRDPLAQTCLLDLLRRTEAENGWPWSYMVQKLSQEWRLTVR